MSVAITEAPVARRTAQVSESARRRPRVLHLITSFEIGGTERQAVELLKRLDGERYDVRLAVLRNEGPFYKEIEARFPDVPEFRLTSFYDANAVKQLLRLRRLMLREKIDILHAHDFYSSFIGAAAARLSGVRVIACQRHLKLSDRRAHNWGTRMIHRLAHRILVNSEAIREHIINHESAQPGKIVVIRNGVVPVSSRANSHDELCRELGLDAGSTLVGIVARLQAVKGHRFFVEAAARVLRSRTDAHFVLVGDGPLRTEIENQAAELGITDRVHLLGDRADVSRLVPAFDLLVLASLHEGLPNAVMEAMVAGVPVVATSVGGTKELIADGETGYLVPPANSAALADRVLFALGDEVHREEIVSAARRRITNAFGIDRMVGSVEGLYDEMMEVMYGRPSVAAPTRQMTKCKNIRVGIVVASIDILGGQAIQALRLVEGLRAEPGIEAELLPINPRLPRPLRWLQRIKYVRTLVTSIAYIASLLVRLPRFDVVHVFSASYFSFLLAPTPAILMSKLYGKPVLLNYHSGEAEDHLRRWPRTALPILRLADRVVVPSDYLVKVFAKFGVRAEAVFNTVDSSRFQFRERCPLKPVLLSNRNLERHYNVECTLQAFALIQKQVPEARLIVAGDGSERRRLHEIAKDLQLSNVDFVGPIAPEQMPELYDRADVFVNASNIDNQPLSIIEAFASGLPVVTTNAGGIPDMVSDEVTGLMVSCGDHAALADRVLNLLGDGELASRIASRAREECNKYSWAAVRNQWLKFYRELAPANNALRSEAVAESSGRM